MDSSLAGHLNLDPHSGVPLIAQITEQLTWLIASGELEEGQQLPPIRQLAEALGVNMHTVRLAYQRLEAEQLVSVRPRQGTRVLAYDPVEVAKLGAESPSYLVGVILPSPVSFYTPFIKVIQEKCRELRYLPLFCYTFEDPYLAETYFNQLIARQVDGFIFTSLGLPRLIEDPGLLDSYPPIVSVDVPDMSGPKVLPDNQGAAYQVTQHLLEHGYRRIGLITPPLGWPNVADFYQGYEKALQQAGCQIFPELIVEVGGFFTAQGQEGAEQLLGLEHPPQAILAASDSLALGALEWIHKEGLMVPGEIALAGYNDIPAAALVTPGLTTAAVPAAQMGELAFQILQNLMERRIPSQDEFTIPTKLCIRHSCGC